MKLVSVGKTASPDTAGFVRLTGIIEMGSGERIDIWFEVPSALEDHLSESGNPWVITMLPYAMLSGETIVSDLPVDAELLENLKGLTAVWCEWYPQFVRPKIKAPVAPLVPLASISASDSSSRRTAAFFSGGVDSWFTILRHAPELEPAAIGRVDDLITVHGFDIPFDSIDEFGKLRDTLALSAHDLGRELIVVRTNLRKNGSLWAKAWGWLTHAAGLATVAMVLEKRYRKVMIGSAYSYGNLIPWGSHPMTDALFSTQTLLVKHDGASYNRVEKTQLLARHQVALRHLHVCWKEGLASNCGKCAKCLRTMTTLQLLGALDTTSPFPVKFCPETLASVYFENSVEDDFIEEVRDLAVAKGDVEIQAAISSALRRSRRVRPFVQFADRLASVPIMWHLGPRIRGWCVR